VLYKSNVYPFKKTLGRGGAGTVGLYGEERLGYLVLKVSYCNDPEAFEKSQRENENAADVSNLPPCDPRDVHWRRGSTRPLEGRDLVRAPLSTLFSLGCSFALYEYLPENLAEWLQHHPRRKPEHVVGIFLQILSIVRCLRRRGFFYDDLKPSNILLWHESPDTTPRVKVGDLGGLDREGQDRITVTPSRLPPHLLRKASWKSLDVLTSFLMGELILQLLIRPPLAGEVHPMNDFLRCIQGSAVDDCLARALRSVHERLADGLSLAHPQIRDMAALALNYLGYKGLYVSPEESLSLSTSLFGEAASPLPSG